jgi:hypothetical protein
MLGDVITTVLLYGDLQSQTLFAHGDTETCEIPLSAA